jgi:hypothetical protein
MTIHTLPSSPAGPSCCRGGQAAAARRWGVTSGHGKGRTMSVAPTLASNSTAPLREATHAVDARSGPHRGCTALPVPVVALSRICHRPITGRSSGLRTLPLYYGQGATRADGMGREGRTGAGLWYPGDGHIRPHREWMTDIGSALGRTDVAGDASSHALASRPLQQDDEERELGRMTQASWCFVLGR